MTSTSKRVGPSADREGTHPHMREQYSFLRSHAMARAIAMALSASIGSLLVTSTTVHAAQTVTQQHTYHIPAGQLGKALDDLGAQGNIQIAYAPELVKGESSPGLSGDFTPTEALHRILDGTGLTWKTVGTSAVVIKPQQTTSGDQEKQENETQKNDQVQADQEKAQNLAPVMVTGSHIRRVDLETANPVVTISNTEIEAMGATTVGDLLHNLTMMTGSSEQPQHHGGHGQTEVSMRGLGSSRTLILVDGRRVISNDVSSIPSAMIDHIEVLKNGASAVYGSDAIGGVINFITKKHFQGAQFSVYDGVSSHSDGRSKKYAFTFGHTSDKGSIVAGVGYSHTDGILAKARSYTKNTVELTGVNADGSLITSIGGSTSSAYGRIQAPSSGPIAKAWADCSTGYLARNKDAVGLDPIEDYHCYVNSGPNSDKYNFATQTLVLKPQTRTNAFVTGTYNLTDKVSAYLSAYYNKLLADFQEAPGTYHTPSVEISKDNYWNPFGVDFGSQGYGFSSRLVGLGNRGANYTTKVAQIATGLKGVFTLFDHQQWNWTIGMNYGHFHESTVTFNYLNQSAMYLGPSFKDPKSGKVTCGTPSQPIANCDASFNPFNMQAENSIKALHEHSVSALSYHYDIEKVYNAEANGGLFDLPAGALQLALGLSYRKEHTNDRIGSLQLIDPTTGDCKLGTGCTSPLEGGYNVKEAYGELFVPILSGMPWAYELNLTIGDRYSRYSTFGSTNNKEFKIEWRPTPNLLLRGSMEEVFRAPTIGDVFGPVSSADPKIHSDPCDGYTGSPADPACVNVPTDGSFVDQYAAQRVETSIRSSGSEYAGFPLKPETGKSFDIGLVYNPPWMQNLTVSLDQWHVYLNDTITSVGLQNILNLCSSGVTVYCPLIHRYPSGPQQGQFTQETIETVGNLGSVSTGGTDIFIDYKLPTRSFGNFDFKVNATYLKYYDAQTAPGTPANQTFHYAGHFMGVGSTPASDCPNEGQCLFPRWKANAFAQWSLGNWSATWKIRYIHHFRMGSASPSQDTHPAGSDLEGFYLDYGSRIYHDVSLGYNIKPLHTRVMVGARNLFNDRPPLVFENNASYGMAAMTYDLIGRYYWARAVVSF